MSNLSYTTIALYFIWKPPTRSAFYAWRRRCDLRRNILWIIYTFWQYCQLAHLCLIYLSVCLSIYLYYVCLFVYLLAYLPTFPSTNLATLFYLSTRVSVWWIFHLPNCLTDCLSFCLYDGVLSIWVSVCLSIIMYLPTCLSDYLSIWL